MAEHGALAGMLSLTARGTIEVGRWGGPGPKVVALPTAGRCDSLVVSPIPVNEQDDGALCSLALLYRCVNYLTPHGQFSH